MTGPWEELEDAQFQRITEGADIPQVPGLRDLARSLLDLPRATWLMTKLYLDHPELPPADIHAAFTELDQPGRTSSEIALILAHRLNTGGTVYHPAPDEVL